jgi:TolB-like protein/DNA-binding winged helix-turn-helix (wHTH) protein
MPVQGNQICFGVFAVDRDTRELSKHGIRVKLEDQPFEVLLALLEKPGAVVTRTELQARIWPDGTFVDFDKSLTKAVNKIRTVLEDSAATPRYIETLSRRGYRFIAPVGTAGELAPSVLEAQASPGTRRRLILWIAAALPVLGLGIGIQWNRLRPRVGPERPIESLVVLPMVNLTGDDGQEYFTDGLTDDLISDLARIRPLRVISFTSAMHYKGTQKSLPEIARELAVDAVIEGSVQRAGGRLRINAKLVRGAADRQVWSESYEAEGAEAARLEGRIALAVANQISAHLTAETTVRLTGIGQANPRAYDAYLHGRYLWNLRGGESVTQAGGYFREAVREDPGFALAWSGLADTYTIGWGAKYDPTLGEVYARKAVALRPDLGEAHASLGFALNCLYRFREAEQELTRGIELTPSYVPAHQFYSIYLITQGLAAEALAENDRALQLDPFSIPVNNMRGLILIGLRQYDRAEKQLRAAVEINPELRGTRMSLARIYWIEHRTEDALAQERVRASGAPRAPAHLDAVFAKPDFRAACLASVELKERLSRETEIPLQYGLLGNKRKVMEWLERFAADKDYGMIYMLKTAPEFDFLREDEDFQGLLRRIGLLR